ncbi:hypothetical protein [Jeotgalibacillus proteolyticus]|uniref:Uncharacterized protein n=1 Tax=Jeotgalibacillus proteolyticus TaxID=2082395 RepID=A0A2S5GCC7_9BACL|nr:hypothetical protein [Jeotgalibacillus proteolyticus]PPA70656.1 hypothetical protein C4B60_07605 [Jeotgalibacillus proteolyticus]
MSLSEMKLGEIVWKQYIYKLFSYSDALKSLIIIQLLGIGFSLLASGGGSSSDGYITVSVDTYSVDLVFIFTLIWIFVTSILLTTKSYRFEDFTFVTSRLSSHLSNILYLITVSAAAMITLTLSSFLLYLLVRLFANTPLLYGGGSPGSPGALLLSAGAFLLYFILVSALGYLAGGLAQIHKSLIAVLPVVLIVLPIYLSISLGVYPLYSFYIAESSFWILGIKIIFTAAILFGGIILLFNNREVRA